MTFPKLFSSFSTENTSDIKIYYNSFFKDFGQEESKRVFSPRLSPDLYVSMTTNTITYHVIPIWFMNYLTEKEISFFLVIQNNFEKSELDNHSQYQKFFVVMIVPSSIFFLISAFVMGIIMKRNFNKIE